MKILSIYLLVCASAAFIYGFIEVFRHKVPVYFELMVFAIASQVFSRAFYVIEFFCYGELPDIFNIGLIGFAMLFVITFFANKGEIDSLVDDGGKKFTKYRVIPAIIPVCEIAVSVAAMFFDYADISIRISFVILSVLAGLAGYFNLKHIIVPDIEDGIIRSIRGFNAMCIILEVFTLSEVGLYCFGLSSIIAFVQAAAGIMYPAVLILLSKEVKKWTL